MASLVQFEYIIALDTYRHFVTASQKCFVTQPTLSMQVKKLEEELGVVIFDRTRQPLVPTEIGVKIIGQAKVIVAESKRIPEMIKEFRNEISGDITIGVIPSVAPYSIPNLVGVLGKKYPEVRVKVIEMLTEDIIKELHKDIVDVGILVTPLREVGITETPLFYEEILLYINKNNVLAKQKEIVPDDMLGNELWLLSLGHCFRSQVINLCGYQLDKNKNYKFEYASGSIETMKKLVEIEGGITLLPELAIEGRVNSKKAVVRNFHKDIPLREVSLVCSRNYAKKKLLEVIAEEIKNVVPKTMLLKDRGVVIEWKDANNKMIV